MTDAKNELIIAKTILSAQAEVIISREKGSEISVKKR